MKEKTATFLRVLDWSATTFIFRVKPKLQGNKYIIMCAADAIDRWEMIAWSVDKVEKHYDNYVFKEIKGYNVLCCKIPNFRKAIELIGYKMVGGPRRFPR